MGIYYRKYLANNILNKLLSYVIIELIIFFKSFTIASRLNFGKKHKDCYLISDIIYDGLKNRVSKQINSIQKLSDELENCEIIFDSNYLNYKNIICAMVKLYQN